MTKSLLSLHKPLASADYQIELLDGVAVNNPSIPKFADKLNSIGQFPLKPDQLEIFQVNLGKMCNQTCRHCHVDAGPDRKEIMTKETMQHCLDVLARTDARVVDLTGGAPEMNPDFRWFVEECVKLGKLVMVRCNLTIIVANKKYYDLPEFYKENNCIVISSLPFYNADRTDRQRGEGVFSNSVKALKMLNAVGYGMENTGLELNLVYNPSGAFLPSAQSNLEQQFKNVLADEFDVYFNSLFAITNLPISRFLDYLIESRNYTSYMENLVNAFNPAAAAGVMCRNTISVGWDGHLYDCDFNQMLELKVDTQNNHITRWDINALNSRHIILNQHCYGCTAGAGSSCGGQTA